MRERVPQRKSFYVYIMFLMVLHAISCVGGLLVLTCQSVGLCFTMSSRILSYALFAPVLYGTFLHGNLDRGVYEQMVMESQEANQNGGRVSSLPSVIKIDQVYDEKEEEEQMKAFLSKVKQNKRRRAPRQPSPIIVVNDADYDNYGYDYTEDDHQFLTYQGSSIQ